MASLHFHKIKHITNKTLNKKEAAWRTLTQSVSFCVGPAGCFPKNGPAGKPGTQHSVLHSLPTTPSGPDSDVESREGLHQGDLRVRIRFASGAVPVATPALQGFVAVPLLLPLLLLQSLLLSPLFVCDLEEKTLGESPARLTQAATCWREMQCWQMPRAQPAFQQEQRKPT